MALTTTDCCEGGRHFFPSADDDGHRIKFREPDNLTHWLGKFLVGRWNGTSNLLVPCACHQSRHGRVVARTLFGYVVTEVTDGKLIGGVLNGPSIEDPPSPNCTWADVGAGVEVSGAVQFFVKRFRESLLPYSTSGSITIQQHCTAPETRPTKGPSVKTERDTSLGSWTFFALDV